MKDAWPWGARLRYPSNVFAAHQIAREVWQGIGRGIPYPAEAHNLLGDEAHTIEESVHCTFGRGHWDPAQLLIRWPADDTTVASQDSHVDRAPDGSLYDLIVGFYVTEAYPALEVAGNRVEVNAGDIVWWRGDTPHRGLLNLTSEPKIVLYFRRRK